MSGADFLFSLALCLMWAEVVILLVIIKGQLTVLRAEIGQVQLMLGLRRQKP